MFRSSVRLAGLVVLALVIAWPAAAQIQTGSILVRLTDAQGAALPGATVTISSPNLVVRQMAGVTDSGGAYRFPSLPPGTYQVKFELPGFKTVVRDGIVVDVGVTTPLDQQMQIAGVQETVTVTGQTPTLDKTSANVSTMLDEKLLQETPGGRDIWSLMEYKVPGLTIDRPDVGGNAGGLQGAMSVRGTENGQNTHFLNGVNVGDPAAIGYTQFYYDYDAFDQIQVSVGAHDLSVQSGGLFLNMVTKSGTNQWHGRASGYYQGSGTQGTNVDDNLLNLGLSPTAGAVKFVSDGNFNVGGPIVKDKLRVFGSFRDWRVHVNVPGFPEVEQTNMTSGLGNITYQINERNRLTGFVARQRYDKPNRGASAFNTPASDWKELDTMSIYQALWNTVISGRSFLDARASYADIFFPLYLKSPDLAVFDTATNIISGSNFVGYNFKRKRLQANANLSYFLDNLAGTRHEFRVGVDYSHAPTTAFQYHNGDIVEFTRAGVPSFVTEYNTPVFAKQTVDGLGAFAQDSIAIRRLTVNAGVRFQHTEGYLPAQSSPAGTFTGPRSFGEIRNIIRWNTASPRVGAIYDITGDGKTTAKASFARYFYVMSTGDPDTVNQNSSSSNTYAWNDLNGDGVFQLNEQGRLLQPAGAQITSFDPNLKQPYTDEFLVGFEREVIPDLRVSVVGTLRHERRQYAPFDLGVPASAYSPVTITDPGPDGVTGTADDRPLTVFNQDEATIGQNRLLITNTSLRNQDYHGIEVTASKRFSRRWQMLAGYTYGRAVQVNTNPLTNNSPQTAVSLTDPNASINATGRPYYDRPHAFKVSGSYLLPYDINASANLLVQSGTAWSYNTFFDSTPFRALLVTTLNQGPITVFTNPPGDVRTPTVKTLDVRGAKTFTLHGTRALEASVDVYNLFNANTAWDMNPYTGTSTVTNPKTGTTQTVPQFGIPIGILGPRIVRFGVRFTF